VAIFYAALHAFSGATTFIRGVNQHSCQRTGLSRIQLQFYVMPEANPWHRHARHLRVCARTYVYDANIITQGVSVDVSIQSF
jgi:hypothetical protein